MAGLNKLTVIGYLGRDPDKKFTANDKAMATFSVAMDTGWGDNKETLWLDVTCFGKLADVAADYLVKGSQVYLEGPVSLNMFERKNGDAGASIRLTVDKLVMLGSKNGSGGKGDRGDRDEREPVGSGRRGSSRSAETVDDLPW